MKLLQDIKEIREEPMDFVGSDDAAKHQKYILNGFLLLAMAVGGIRRQIHDSFYVVCAGYVVMLILTVPAWPWYRKNAIIWLAPLKVTEKRVFVDSDEEEDSDSS
ncbi:MAG: uncharacterized protein KVP18_005138 [Porospora cf. gigantea A]|uniref:uncharacterized protein n=1 Tax=Porospora cf. gigantea A TaxID=2853593 RepID=UPI00355A16E0|nr:MAG: hypothetical protein KVP18_005138 [Porospora cf. gigantea A]